MITFEKVKEAQNNFSQRYAKEKWYCGSGIYFDNKDGFYLKVFVSPNREINIVNDFGIPIQLKKYLQVVAL